MSRYDGGEVPDENSNGSMCRNSGVPSKRNIIAVIITVAMHLFAVWYGTGMSNTHGFLASLGEYIFFLFCGSISAAIDAIWLVRLARRKNFSNKKCALITVLIHLVFLVSLYFLPHGNFGLAFTVFGFIVCGMLDLIWSIHGIKCLYKKLCPEASPKKMFAYITVVLNISALFTVLLILTDFTNFTSELFDCFLILTPICIVIDLIWLILSGTNRAIRGSKK